MKRLLMSMVKVGVALLAVVALVPQANALTLDSVGGTWSNVVGALGTFVTVGDENQVRWGGDAGFGQSGLGFTGSAPPPAIFNVGDEFEVGTLRHFNNPVYAPWATAVDLTIALDFSDPAVNPLFTFTFGIDETPNVEPCAYPSATACSDRISFPALPGGVFNIGGTLYTLELTGFRTSPGGALLPDFISDEGGTNSAFLYGRITTANAVPEPATLLLLGSGLAGMIAIRKKLKARSS